MTSLLELEHLSVTFPTRAGPARAVEDVSLAIAPGETVALVGESGCGKTVTALSVLRLLPESATLGPESRIRFDGRDVLALGREELRRLRGGAVGMVFQEPGASLNPVLTIGAHLVETIQAHDAVDRATARARARELLATVGLRDPDRMVARYPHELSGGMQQRAYLAMALAARPRLLIADEPTTALDVTTQAQILALLADLTGRLGMAMLLITHNLGIAAAVADRVAVMYAGRIVEVAPRAALFAHPAHPYTRGLLQAAPRLDGPTRPTPAIPGAVPSATAWPEGCRFRPRCAHAWDRCNSEPTLAATAPDHTARCWLVTEPRGGTA
ncbi:MAG TPA: ABC transporter ATP-binding protein [Gemmatimonadales bacterium]|jgi:oligopeptide/dipeptide ABC transporter ATP-binding protein